MSWRRSHRHLEAWLLALPPFPLQPHPDHQPLLSELRVPTSWEPPFLAPNVLATALSSVQGTQHKLEWKVQPHNPIDPSLHSPSLAVAQEAGLRQEVTVPEAPYEGLRETRLLHP